MRAKKSLGQHFLKSERALNTIVEAGKITSGEIILEIGPGEGALTEKLLQTEAKVVTVEKDDNLFEFLKKKFAKEIDSGRLQPIHDDILNFEAMKLAKLGSYKLIANIPYNITGAILEKFLSAEYQPERMVLLVQKEVAERIMGWRGHRVSTPSKESILSISVKAYGKPVYIETVKAGSFVPRPAVDSAIIAIEGISKKFFNRGSKASTNGEKFAEKAFFRLLRAGFQAKRKKLSSNLSLIFEKEKVKETFQNLNLDENLRAEDLNIDIWRKLAESLLLK